MTNLVIEEGVSTFDSLVFSNCDALTSVTIPGSLKSIGNSVFQSCDALTKVIFAEGCTSTGTKTFYYRGEKVELKPNAEKIFPKINATAINATARYAIKLTNPFPFIKVSFYTYLLSNNISLAFIAFK